MKLRTQLIRLAHKKPELRPHLLPLLQKRASYSKDRGYSGFQHTLAWGSRGNASEVPTKFRAVWDAIDSLGNAISKANPKRSRRNAVITWGTMRPSVTANWWQSENEDKGNSIRIELPLFVEVFIGGEKIRTWTPSTEEKQAILKFVKKHLKGSVKIKHFLVYHNKISMTAAFPAWSTKAKANWTEVSVPSGEGYDREMVLHALERRLGFYPEGFTVESVTPFEDDEDLVSVRWW